MVKQRNSIQNHKSQARKSSKLISVASDFLFTQHSGRIVLIYYRVLFLIFIGSIHDGTIFISSASMDMLAFGDIVVSSCNINIECTVLVFLFLHAL